MSDLFGKWKPIVRLCSQSCHRDLSAACFALPSRIFSLLDGVHPETKDFGRDQGARKILPQAYDLLYTGLHVIINHLVSEYSIMGKWILVSGVVETENNNSVIHSHRFRIDTAEVTEAKNTPDGQ